MNPTLVALIWLPCVSPVHQSALGNETIVMVCPDTVKYVYDTAQVEQKPAPVVAKKRAAPPKKKYRKRRKRK